MKQLGQALLQGHRWDIVFNICEGMYGIGREAQVPAMLDAWNIPYVFSGPFVLSLTLHKGMTKSVVRDAGIPTADFQVVRSAEDFEGIALPFPFSLNPSLKVPVKVSMAVPSLRINGSWKWFAWNYLKNSGNLSGRRIPQWPGIHGWHRGDRKRARAVGTMEIILQEDAETNSYSYLNKENYIELVNYTRAPAKEATECEKVALDAWRVLECEDAGRVDIRYNDSGEACFIEVNPLAGLNPVHSDLPILCGLNGISYTMLIKMIMDSAVTKSKPAANKDNVPMLVPQNVK